MTEQRIGRWWADRSDEIEGRRVGPFFDFVPPYDWDWVAPSLATGAMPLTSDEVDFLVESGITHVVSVNTEAATRMREVLSDARLVHLKNALPDDFGWKPPGWFKRTVDFAVPAIDKGGKVFVHCLLGSNRGPSHAYAILRGLDWTHADALAAVREARPKASLLYAHDARAAMEGSRWPPLSTGHATFRAQADASTPTIWADTYADACCSSWPGHSMECSAASGSVTAGNLLTDDADERNLQLWPGKAAPSRRDHRHDHHDDDPKGLLRRPKRAPRRHRAASRRRLERRG